MKRGDLPPACLGLLLLLSAADAGAAAPDPDPSGPSLHGSLDPPGFQAWLSRGESFADADLPCPEGNCGPPRSPPGTGSDDGKSPSDTTGYLLLAAIPVIVGVGTLAGADHRLAYDNSGIWKRRNQLDLEYAVILTEVGGGLWEGGESRLGRTYWESIDSTVSSALAVQALKFSTGRERPSQSASPNHWRHGGAQSFPSGEVTLQAGFVTPVIAEYAQDDPWVWGLETLPLYDSIARLKTRGHWQTDVLSGWALGTAFGIFAHNRRSPFFLGYMPHGVMVGWRTTF